MWLPAHLLYFVGGMVLAVLQVLGVRVPLLVAGPTAVLGYLIVSAQIAGDVNTGEVTLWQNMLKVALYAAIACSVVALLVLGGTNGFERLLSAAPIVWLGEISYEIFLLHVITMEIVMASVLHWPVFTGSMPVIFIVTLVITIPLAWLLHRWTRRWARPSRERLLHGVGDGVPATAQKIAVSQSARSAIVDHAIQNVLAE